MNEPPRHEIIRLWMPKEMDNIYALGNSIVRCDVTNGYVTTPIAFCASPVVAQALVETLKEKIARRGDRLEGDALYQRLIDGTATPDDQKWAANWLRELHGLSRL